MFNNWNGKRWGKVSRFYETIRNSFNFNYFNLKSKVKNLNKIMLHFYTAYKLAYPYHTYSLIQITNDQPRQGEK